jgi:hypothetical protein
MKLSNKYYLATNLTDPEEFSVEKIKQLYHDRFWLKKCSNILKITRTSVI